MSDELLILVSAAASIAFLHTLLGPDHYLPFIVMNKAGKWSLRKTTIVTLLSGLGHVIGSVVLGLIGVALGIAISKLEGLESFRGSIAAWALISFGMAYFIWGLRIAIKNRPHKHIHAHHDGVEHHHEHHHYDDHSHFHEEKNSTNYTPWILFTIFVLGPCEPLIPLLMYPAAKESHMALIIVTGVFAIVTIATMLTVVLVSTIGFSFLPLRRFERYTHAMAGATISMSGMAIHFLGL